MKGRSIASSRGGNSGTQTSQHGLPSSDQHKDKQFTPLELTTRPNPTDLDKDPTFSTPGYLVHVSSSKGSEEDTDEERSTDLPQGMLLQNGIGIHRTYTVESKH